MAGFSRWGRFATGAILWWIWRVQAGRPTLRGQFPVAVVGNAMMPCLARRREVAPSVAELGVLI